MTEFTLEDYLLANKIVSSCTAVLALMAATGNFVLFLTILRFRSKNIQSICSVLIAIQALVEVVYPLSVLSFTYVSFAEVQITRRSCLFWQSIPLAAANASIVMMPVVAVDRFVSLKFALWYNRLNRTLYISVLMMFPVAYHAICTYLGILSVDEKLLICRLPDGYTQTAIMFWVGSQVVIALFVLFLYFLVRFELKSKKGGGKDVSAAISKSLQIIFILYVFGYTLFALINIGSMLIHDYYLFLTVGSLSSSLALVNIAAPVFVFYKNSRLYRKEIKATLRFLLRIRTTTNVQVVSREIEMRRIRIAKNTRTELLRNYRTCSSVVSTFLCGRCGKRIVCFSLLPRDP
ncbi:hypothetical protein QR680_016877 [Steinernema hermaphroditum]|uniref:G-protein coupled receptors family 1 profile domain-containing protein n=1 Tax=Steinernema hermaphroditum TaxID=289476 RepID=A0AA39HDP3_9BILA|nr:hypothetical protein QR680_016877 [Steinernema hermaphroditum]